MLSKFEKHINNITLNPKDFVDIRYSFTESESFTVRNSRFDSISSQSAGGISVRALIDNSWGFATSIKTDDETIKKTIDTAIRIARVGAQYAKDTRSIGDQWVFEGKGITSMKIDPREIDKETKFDILLKMERSAREYSDNIAQASTSYTESHTHEAIVNNRGTKVENESHVIRLMNSVVGREGTKMQNVFDSIGGTGGWELVNTWDPEKEGRESAELAVKLIHTRNPPSGKMNVIMDPSLTGVFIHEAFGHACEADAILAKTSILEGKLGKKVGHETINVIDDPSLPGVRGSFTYDSEGTKAKKRILVKNGVLNEYFHTLETAESLGMTPNGAGRAMNFNYPPLARMGNTYVDSGSLSLEEIVEQTKDGVYLTNSYGGYVDPAKGQFYFTCQSGYFIENGEIKDMMGNVGLSGMIMEVLANTYGVSKGHKYSFLGTCGKSGQMIPVTGGGPNIGVSNLVVGGN